MRFLAHCYHSWPNAVETLLVVLPIQLLFGWGFLSCAVTLFLFVLADVVVEMSDTPN